MLLRLQEAKLTVTLTQNELKGVIELGHVLAELETPGWRPQFEATCQQLLELFEADFVGTTHRNAFGTIDNALCLGRDVTMARSYVDEFQFHDPFAELKRSKRGPMIANRLVDSQFLRHSSYYNEFLVPYKTVYGLDLHLWVADQEIGDLRIWRAPDRTPFDDRELVMLGLLEPIYRCMLRRVRAQPVERFDDVLTRRERDVAQLVVTGKSDEAIARALGISNWTVRTHLTSIFNKFGVRNRTAFSAVARERGTL